MRFIPSGLFEELTQSVGALTFSSWKGVQYARSKTASVLNSSSSDQGGIRGWMTASSKRWTSVLTQVQRDAWETYAGGLSPGDPGPTPGLSFIPQNKGVMSGFNAYVMIQCVRHAAFLTWPTQWQDDAPCSPPPNPPTDLECSCCFYPGAGNIAHLEWTDPSGVPAPPPPPGHIRIWVYAEELNIHRQQQYFRVYGFGTWEVFAVKAAQGKEHFIWTLPGFYLFQIDYVDPQGQRSTPSNVCRVEIPTAACPACL